MFNSFIIFSPFLLFVVFCGYFICRHGFWGNWFVVSCLILWIISLCVMFYNELPVFVFFPSSSCEHVSYRERSLTLCRFVCVSWVPILLSVASGTSLLLYLYCCNSVLLWSSRNVDVHQYERTRWLKLFL